MHNWIPKNKIVRFAQGLALFSVVLYFVGLAFVFSETKKIENFYQGTESDSFKEKKFVAIKAVVEANKESIQALRDFFIEKGDEVEFIEKIEEVAGISGVKFVINSIDIKNNQTGYYEEVVVKIKTEGSWLNTVSFVDSLNKIPFGVLIEKINIDTSKVGQWFGLIDVIIFRKK